MAVFRILEARARPGAVDRVAELLVRQNDQVVATAPGALFSSALRSGEEDMQRYLDREVTQEFYRALPELLMGMPSIRTYEEIRPGDGFRR
jgi:quinol monooxygenase YgiN